ncbi:MAG TPA: branched-chain amino acid ABC transporter permease/ATP-binding protein [Acidimicrobiales bacterium]|nr:branched-chain amino acid ABC transporter permease/ATP-binding protein [Acidimicrobiales bacterium]
MLLATWITRQLAFDGLMAGLVFGLLAMGIVLVYRSTRVINFAVGNLGMVGTGLFLLLAVQYSVPYWLAAVAGLAVGTAYGAVVELVVIRRLFDAPRVIVLVATIGVAELSLAILRAYPAVDVAGARFPLAVGADHRVLDVRVTGAQLMILVTVPLVAAVLGGFLTRTTLGRTVKASSDNADLARLSGINPKVVSLVVWAVAGFLATLSLALVAGQGGTIQDLDTLGPSTLVRALAAAVIAGLASFPRALLAGVAIGLVQAIVQFNWVDQPGLTDFLLLVGILVAVYLQSRSRDADAGSFAFTPRTRAVPERLRRLWWVRQLDRAGLAVLGVVAVVVPLIVTQPSRHLLYTTIVGFALCALSLTVLTGWAGQLSLGQMAFAGLAALLAAGFQRGLTTNIGWGETRLVNARLEPLGFAPSAILAVLITAGLAALIGAGALRVRGLLLAVSTFAFAVAASQYLFRRPLLTGGAVGPVRFPRTGLFSLDLSSPRSFYFFALACLVVAAATVARLRSTGVGRTTIAVRDNPDAAAAYTVGPARTKLRAFALAGAIAGLGGIVLAGSIESIPNDRFFTVGDSLQLVAMVVIGGLGSVAGAVLGALWVVGLPAFFSDSELVPLLTSSLGLLVLLLYLPGGLVQIAYAARDALLARAERRLGPSPAKQRGQLPVRVSSVRPPLATDRAALDVRGARVRFGGIVAVDDVTLTVASGEIVGLIGTNGAGKSTLMDAVGGFVIASGRVELLGADVAGRGPAARARAGLGRTFQAVALFPELTVRETVAVALEARGRTGLLSAALWLPRSVRGERARRAEADELIDFLGLGRYADAFVSELSTGTRRIVELAGLLALDARVLCLDEPTAGVAQRETEAFGPLIVEIRRQLGASMLVVEHDMPLIMGISDRVVCLEAGRVIAEGEPGMVRNDPAVIASYLGTDERAIARSGAVTTVSTT